MPDSYVCAFRGRRDSYQVPLALAKAKRLDAFYTDIYADSVVRQLAGLLPSPWDEKLRSRYEPGLPAAQVRCLWKTTMHEWARHLAGRPKPKTWALLDAAYSRAASRRASETDSNLLLYTPYAWEAFTSSYSHQPRRILFQYHPHAACERRILRKDAEQFSEIGFSTQNRAETGASLTREQQQRTENAWQHADTILCASTFTKGSLVAAGADPDTCLVIPYGVSMDAPEQTVESTANGFRVLFVGSGVQRKGVHHLLRAWEEASLPATSRLTLVCRTFDPALKPLISDADQVDLRQGVSHAELIRLYQTSTLFAMPSLIEGFGQVYLEALHWGCPVLGTPHTCLPDIGTEEEGVFTVASGDVEALLTRLEHLARALPEDSGTRQRAKKQAQVFTWERFRKGIRKAL